MNPLVKNLLHQFVAFLKEQDAKRLPDVAPFVNPLLDVGEQFAAMEIDKLIPMVHTALTDAGWTPPAGV